MTRIEERVRDTVLETRAPELTPSWATVATRGRRIARRRRMGRALVAMGVIGAVVLGIVYVTQSPDTSSRSIIANPGPDQAPKTGDVVSAIPPGEYLYARTTGTRTLTTLVDGAGYSFTVPTTFEFWVGADRSGRVRITDGEAKFLTPENEQAFYRAGLTLPAARPSHLDDLSEPGAIDATDLGAFPVDEVSLRAKLAQLVTPYATDPARLLGALTPDNWSITTYGPAANRRALVSVLSSTPGMTVRSEAGMTVVSADSQGIRDELWFDPTSGEARRRRRIVIDATIPAGLRARNGTVLVDETLEVATLVASTDLTAP
jgi:hypothetical protein